MILFFSFKCISIGITASIEQKYTVFLMYWAAARYNGIFTNVFYRHSARTKITGIWPRNYLIIYTTYYSDGQ